MVGTGDMAGTLCWFATPRGGILVRCGVASTFGPAGDGVAKGRTGMGLGGRSF